ncbi:MAG TPA: glycosyl hydrolase family 8 [Lacunisphaera sp.]
MRFLRFIPLLVALLGLSLNSGRAEFSDARTPAGSPSNRNLFRELLGKSETELDAKLDAAWRHFFAGDADHQRLYYAAGADQAYIADTGNNDVRSEGMSYGMMLAVQLDKKAEFDRLWRWADQHMRHAGGPRKGYFAWQCKFDGTQLDPGSASDGEEWFATALLFASCRWGDGQGVLNYSAEAQALLREMLRKQSTSEVTSIFDRQEKQVVFVPNPEASRFTDPSYHLPAFYEIWARWSKNAGDRRTWLEIADTSRAFFRRAAHPQTGLMPEYAHFSGAPFTATTFGAGKGDFRYDAWRTLANVSLDYAWWRADPWQVEQSNRVLRFLGQHAPAVPNQFSLDGKPLSTDTSIGLIAMAAVAGQAADPALARPFVEQLWNAPLPEGRWRYYNGLLYFLGLLQAGGRFHAYLPPSP